MYYEIGYPNISILAGQLLWQNPLADAYDLSYWNPEFVKNKTALNEQFLLTLGIDHTFYPNYESIYLNSLKSSHSNIYDNVENSIYHYEAGDAIDAILNIILDEAMYWPLYNK